MTRAALDDPHTRRALPVRLPDGSIGWKMFGRDPVQERAEFWGRMADADDIAARSCPARAVSVRRSKVPRWLVWGETADGQVRSIQSGMALGHTEADALSDALATFPGFARYRVERVSQGYGWRK